MISVYDFKSTCLLCNVSTTWWLLHFCENICRFVIFCSSELIFIMYGTQQIPYINWYTTVVLQLNVSHFITLCCFISAWLVIKNWTVIHFFDKQRNSEYSMDQESPGATSAHFATNCRLCKWSKFGFTFTPVYTPSAQSRPY